MKMYQTTGNEEDRFQLTENWGIRKLHEGGDNPRWALQYMGMDWHVISEFLQLGNKRSTLDADMRKFAEEVMRCVNKE